MDKLKKITEERKELVKKAEELRKEKEKALPAQPEAQQQPGKKRSKKQK